MKKAFKIKKRKEDKKMTKVDLVNVVAAETSFTKKDVETALNSAFAAISNALKDGDKVQIFGFGTFEIKDTAAREGRNPKTGEVISIPASKKPYFAASKVLKDKING